MLSLCRQRKCVFQIGISIFVKSMGVSGNLEFDTLDKNFQLRAICANESVAVIFGHYSYEAHVRTLLIILEPKPFCYSFAIVTLNLYAGNGSVSWRLTIHAFFFLKMLSHI